MPQRQTWPVVQRVNSVHREALEQPLFHHFARAAEVLLRGLKDKMHGAAKVAGLRKVRGGGQQHGGVAVMAAGMHHASTTRTIFHRPLFSDR